MRALIDLALVSASRRFRERVQELISGARDMRLLHLASSMEALGPGPVSADLFILHLDAAGPAAVLSPEFLRLRRPVIFVSASFGAASAHTQNLQGAWGWVPPGIRPEEFQAAVRAVLEGFVSVYASALSAGGRPVEVTGLPADSGNVRRTAAADRSEEVEQVRLPAREQEILELLSEGYRNSEIAGFLRISGNTVKFHLAGLYERLGVSSRAEAVREGIRLGLLSV